MIWKTQKLKDFHRSSVKLKKLNDIILLFFGLFLMISANSTTVIEATTNYASTICASTRTVEFPTTINDSSSTTLHQNSDLPNTQHITPNATKALSINSFHSLCSRSNCTWNRHHHFPLKTATFYKLPILPTLSSPLALLKWLFFRGLFNDIRKTV